MALEGESEPAYLRERISRKQRARNRRVHPLLLHETNPLHPCGLCFETTTQAPAGFQEQSQEEDHVDRLSDYADMQASLEVREFWWLIWRVCNVAYDPNSDRGRFCHRNEWFTVFRCVSQVMVFSRWVNDPFCWFCFPINSNQSRKAAAADFSPLIRLALQQRDARGKVVNISVCAFQGLTWPTLRKYTRSY